MIWLSTELAEYVKKEEGTPRAYTMDEINSMLDEAEANFEAGRGIPHEEVMRELREEFAAEELEMA
jgi:predicted transcriptional regulator